MTEVDSLKRLLVRFIERKKVGQPDLALFRYRKKVPEQTGTFSENLGAVVGTIRSMPRNPRCILPGVAYHVTQRGVDRADVFFSQADRTTYLTLLRDQLSDAGVRALA